MTRKLGLDYINRQLKKFGYIEECDNGISYCPYCGYPNIIIFSFINSTYKEETQCKDCGNDYLETREILCKMYVKTERLPISDKDEHS